jgi:hypothetical protein
MLQWIFDHWFGITVYWCLCYAMLIEWWFRKLNKQGAMSIGVALILFVISPLLPWMTIGSMVGKFIKAGKGPDHDN